MTEATRPSATRTPSRYRLAAPAEGVSLSMSGGGFRAVFFHLGALRYLYERTLLPRIDAFAAVSGGSIIAALLGLKWSKLSVTSPSLEVWEREVATPLRAFARADHRTGPLTRSLISRYQAVEHLANHFEILFGGALLEQLPDSPRVILCGSNLTTGSLWWTERGQIGDAQLGFQHPPQAIRRLATAVAISSCFPPAFPPLKLELDAARFVPGAIRNARIRQTLAQKTLLNDGGTYDNLGLEPVWGTFRVLLVSDAGAPLEPYRHTLVDRLTWHALRSTELNDQLGRLARRRWFISQLEDGSQAGAYWGIGSAPVDLDRAFQWGYSRDLVRTRVARVRTDLACFDEMEQDALENHGYAMAYAATHAWAFGPLGLSPSPDPPVLPHASALDESAVDDALRYSHIRLRSKRWLARQLAQWTGNAH